MRLIGQVEKKQEAKSFCSFLFKEGIESNYHEGQGHFDIWVSDEDKLEKANHWLSEFQKDPTDSRFKVEEHPIDTLGIKKEFPKKTGYFQKQFSFQSLGAPITRALLFICIAIYALEHFMPHLKEWLAQIFLYDTPTTNPFWVGLYKIALAWPASESYLYAPLFEKIREGQLWRLFTPCLFHGNLLHILFNMLWLWTLGRQMEERIKMWQYILITLGIGIISNTVQYLIGGPFFLGYSGVICGLAGFIWMRQRLAPWEGYPLEGGTTAFLGIFVLGMVALQIVSFILMRFEIANFPIDIANGAHVAGALSGIVIGSLFKK